MVIRRSFKVDSLKIYFVYGLLALLGLAACLDNVISPLVFVVYLAILLTLWFTNRYFGRVEISDDGIEGPGPRGPSHRVFIPWEKADIDFGRRDESHYRILVKDPASERMIKIVRGHFHENTLKLLREMMVHHHPHRLTG